MTEPSRYQQSSSFRMQAEDDGEIVHVDVFSEFVDGTTRWSTERPEWRESDRKTYLGPDGRTVLPADGSDEQFHFEDTPHRLYRKIAPYE